MVLFIMLYKVVTLESVDEILKCDHCDAVYYVVQGGSNF